MANIQTQMGLLQVGDPNPSNIGFGVAPGHVQMAVKNEGVIHVCLLDPNEAVQMGIALIQMGGRAQAAGQNVMTRERANGGIIVPQ